jgi:hypothetical protein
VLNLCGELGKRGHQVTLAYRRPPFEVSDSIEKRVREKGIRATDQFRLNHVLKFHNGFAIGDNLHDFIHLPRFIEEERFDIVKYCERSSDPWPRNRGIGRSKVIT